MPYITYADLESLVKKIDGCENNPEKSSKTKIGEHIPCGYSMSTIERYDHIEYKHSLYLRKDCMKKFCESLGEHPKSIIDFEKTKCYLNKKRIEIIYKFRCYICRITFLKKCL